MISKWNKSFESLFFNFYNTDPKGKNPQLNLGFTWRLRSTIHHTKKNISNIFINTLLTWKNNFFCNRHMLQFIVVKL